MTRPALASAPAPLRPADLARFGDLLRSASGLEVPEVRQPELEHAVQQALADTASTDTDALYHLLGEERGRPALDALVEALTIGETHFFRNRPQFEALTAHILPELIERRRGARQLRLWSAGCASGEEAYSLAILVECLLPDLDQWQVHILATDINRQSLAKAQRGVYSRWSFREVPPDIQGNFFVQRGRDYEIVPRLRDRVTFEYLNLVVDSYPSLLTRTVAMDLILFRNVLIYFREATTRQVVGRLHRSLADGGWLVVGHADTSPGVFEQFTVHNFPGTVVYQKTPAAAAPAGGSVFPAFAVEPLAAWGRFAAPASPAGDQPAGAPRPAPARPAAPRVPPSVPAPASEPALGDPYREALELWQRDQPEPALRLLKTRTASATQDAWAPYLAAKIQANRQQLSAAEALVEVALRRDPLLAAAHYLHGLILQETGRPEAALAALRRCVYAGPQFVLGHFALANLLVRVGQPERAQKSFDNVTRWLANRPRDEQVAEGDGLTAGRLTELIAAQKELAAEKELK